MVHTRKLKTILQSKIFFSIFLIFTVIFVIINLLFPPATKLNVEDKKFEGKILEYNWQNEEKIKMKIQIGKEKVIAYFETKENNKYKKILQEGVILKIQGTLCIPSKNTIPNTFSYHRYLKTEKIYFELKITDLKVIKENSSWKKIKEKIRDYCDQFQNSFYLKMLVLGIKEGEKEDIEKIYQKNGISHVFAISGMHLGMLYKLTSKQLKKIKNWKKHIISILVVTIYVSLINVSISSKRAYCFLLLNTINQIFCLNLTKKQIFFFTLCVILWINPFSIFQVGFQYSFLTSFLFLFWIEKKKKSLRSIIFGGFLIFLFHLPITAYNSYTINIWSIINNIVLIPIILFVIFPLLLLSLICPILEIFISIVINGFEFFNFLLSNLPLSEIILPKMPLFWYIIYYFLLLLYIALRKSNILILLGIFLCLWNISPKWNKNGYFYFLDVGQGDAILIVAPYQKEVILIDTGPQNRKISSNIINFLRSLGIKKLNVLFITHGDQDHIGNAITILNEIPTEKIILNEGSDTSLEIEVKKKYKNKISKTYQTKYLKFKILDHVTENQENDNSLICHVCIYQTCSLFLGDAGKKVEEEIASKYQIKADILKVGHHGSNTSTSNALLKEFSFKFGIISAGRNNKYHHPHEITLKNLNKNKIKIMNTQKLGTISFKVLPKGYTTSYFPP